MRVTEKEIIQRLQSEGSQYAPLTIYRLEEQVLLPQGLRADAIIEFSLPNGLSFEALVEITPVATPKSIRAKCRTLADLYKKANNVNLVPMIIAPYVARRQAEMLAEEGVSWIDLSGNMMVRVSNQIYIERTGKKNRFPDTAPIKKIFQGTSSIVSRALLLKPNGFSSLYEIVDFINNRNASITISTVSKVLKCLEEELLIKRKKPFISAADREKLLERLADDYINSPERKTRKTYGFATDSTKKLFRSLFEKNINYVAFGFYAAQIKGLAITDQTTIFVKDIEQVKEAAERNWVEITPDAQFGNVNITETKEPGVWFNASLLMYDAVVDDVELYLELMADTPRGPKIAAALKGRILRDEIDE